MAKRVRKSVTAADTKTITGLLGGVEESAAVSAAAWRHFTPEEHIAWVESHCYRLTKTSGWQPMIYQQWQRREMKKIFAVEASGLLRYKTVMTCWPRRCAKSEAGGMYDLHRASEYPDQLIVIQGNSADQGTDTVFARIVDTLRNSPSLAKWEGSKLTITASEIVFANGSIIAVLPASEKSTYGRPIHVYHNTELCKTADDNIYQAGASSTGDTWCGVAIIDSNMGDATNPVARYVELGQLAEAEAAEAAAEGRAVDPTVGDPSIGVSYLFFDDLDDVLKRGCGVGLPEGQEPIHPWLDAAWIRGRYQQMTGSEFRRNHCNIASGSGAELWSAELIDSLVQPLLPAICTREMLASLTRFFGGNGQWTIGVGLDRAGAFSKDPDRSVLTVHGKTMIPAWVGQERPIYGPRGEAIGTAIHTGELYVHLAAWEFLYALADPIKSKLLKIDRVWGIDALLLEAYQASDLAEWCEAQRFGRVMELRHMTAQAKHSLVQFVHGLIITRSWILSPHYVVQREELKHYSEINAAGSVPSYGGKRKGVTLELPVSWLSRETHSEKTWIKDDYAESAFWSLEAARSVAPRGRCRSVPKPAGL